MSMEDNETPLYPEDIYQVGQSPEAVEQDLAEVVRSLSHGSASDAEQRGAIAAWHSLQLATGVNVLRRLQAEGVQDASTLLSRLETIQQSEEDDTLTDLLLVGRRLDVERSQATDPARQLELKRLSSLADLVGMMALTKTVTRFGDTGQARQNYQAFLEQIELHSSYISQDALYLLAEIFDREVPPPETD